MRVLNPYLKVADKRLFLGITQQLGQYEQRWSAVSLSGAYGWCHGDAHCQNLLRNTSTEISMIDLELCAVGWRVYDLATYYWQLCGLCFNGEISDRTKAKRWEAFVDGYSSQRALRVDELASVPLFTLVRHLDVLVLQGALMPKRSDFKVWVEHMLRFVDYLVTKHQL